MPLSSLILLWTPGGGQKGLMKNVCPYFCLDVLSELALQFFLKLSMVLGAHVVLCMTGTDFLIIIFLLQNRENRPSLGFFENLVIFFNLVYMKVYIN